MPLSADRHAGGGFVQHQHGWPQAKCNCDFDQALLAVGQLPHRRQCVVRDAQAFEQRIGVFQYATTLAYRAKHVTADACVLADGEADVLQDRQTTEQRVDLERATETASHACRLRQSGDVLARKHDTPG